MTPKPLSCIDPATLPKHFESEAVEARWVEVWERDGVHAYDPTRGREETFVVDTPPPTVSGSLHVGHVFSYTHTDVIVRYQRMKGKNVAHPKTAAVLRPVASDVRDATRCKIFDVGESEGVPEGVFQIASMEIEPSAA